MLACWAENPTEDYFKKHLARILDYIWVAEDGMTMQVRIYTSPITNLPSNYRNIIRYCVFIFF